MSSDLCLTGRFTLTVPEAGKLYGLGRDAAYAAAGRGELPARKVGRRLVVPTHTLLRKLGWPDALIAQALGLSTDTGAATLPEEEAAGSATDPTADVQIVTLMTPGGLHGTDPAA